MRQMAYYLMKFDEPVKTEYAFVLGGNSLDRGNKAIELYKNGFISKIVCTGENIPGVLEAVGNPMNEAELTVDYIFRLSSIDSNRVTALNIGTSTREESFAILNFCLENKVDTAIIISSAYHLRRVRNVFDHLFKENGIYLNYQAAKNSKFNELEWWKSEEGMIAINNEYIKLFYYWWVD